MSADAAAEARLRSARLPAEGHAVFRGDPGQRRKLGVVGQTPAPGALTFGPNLVNYDYIAGPARVRVPDCVQQPVAEAVASMRSASLRVPEEDYRNDPHRSRVASQEPRAASLAARGATVRLTTAPDAAAAQWKHQEAVWHGGAQPCFACHDPVFCANCHLKEKVPEAPF